MESIVHNIYFSMDNSLQTPEKICISAIIYIKKVRKCVIHYGLFSLNNSMSSNPSFKIENVSILSGFAKRK